MFIPAWEFPQRTGSVGSSNGFMLSQNKEGQAELHFDMCVQSIRVESTVPM